jgi:MFS transporter, SHS family, lactate transporter
VTPIYLLTTDPIWIMLGFITQGFFAGAIYGQNPSYLAERFPTEVRSTASGFCYHQGAIFGGFVAPILTYFAINTGVGFGIPMLIGTAGGLVSFILAVSVGPETRGKQLVADIEIFEAVEVP